MPDVNLLLETYNQLNAYFAIVPGNYTLNLRRLYLLNTNYADLSFLFTILAGEKTNEHLEAEYLAVLETDNATPHFLNLHNGEVPHTLILGMTGSGKSYTAKAIFGRPGQFSSSVIQRRKRTTGGSLRKPVANFGRSRMADIRAQVIPWSSVVGTGVMLLDKTGCCIAILGLQAVQLPGDTKDVSLKLAEQIAAAINLKT